MKKLIFLASIALAIVAMQPAQAQVSINVNIGARPYYQPAYYSNSYYVPARPVYHHRPVVVHRPVFVHTRPVYVTNRYYRSSYRPVAKHYYIKPGKHHGKGHFKPGRHGR